MNLGFGFQETMRGTYHLLANPGTEREFAFRVDAKVPDIRRFLFNPTAVIEGTVDAEGMADHRPLHGTLEINPILKRKLIYDFHFDDDEGRECRFHGEKDLELLRPVTTITTLPGSIWANDEEVARAVLRFDLQGDLLGFILSLRPH